MPRRLLPTRYRYYFQVEFTLIANYRIEVNIFDQESIINFMLVCARPECSVYKLRYRRTTIEALRRQTGL